MLEEGTPSIQRLVIARSLLGQSLPLDIGTLGAPYQPAGTDPALGTRPPARPRLRPRGGVGAGHSAASEGRAVFGDQALGLGQVVRAVGR